MRSSRLCALLSRIKVGNSFRASSTGVEREITGIETRNLYALIRFVAQPRGDEKERGRREDCLSAQREFRSAVLFRCTSGTRRAATSAAHFFWFVFFVRAKKMNASRGERRWQKGDEVEGFPDIFWLENLFGTVVRLCGNPTGGG